MTEIRFSTVIGEDRVIRLPSQITLAPGPIEVIVRPQRNGAAPSEPREPIGRRLARFAEEHPDLDLPEDLARNHDHYAHGAPRGIDDE